MIELSFSGTLNQSEELAAALSATGLSPGACDSKARLLAQAATALSVTAGSGGGRRQVAH